MATVKTITVKGKEYTVVKTRRFKTSYGYAGSKGVEIFDKDKKMGKFDSIAEFRKTQRK